jgi:hypothetical protein
MQHQLTPVFNSANVQQLRMVSTDLCEDLESEIKRFETGKVEFSDLKELHYSVYQPRALGLITALTRHVPSGDPRILVLGEDAHSRQYKSTDHIMVNAALNEATVVMQLKDITQRLRQLLTYLPQN